MTHSPFFKVNALFPGPEDRTEYTPSNSLLTPLREPLLRVLKELYRR